MEATPIAQRHHPVGNARRAAIATAAGVLNLVAMMVLASGAGPYHAGLRNVDPPFFLSRQEAWCLAAWAASGLALIGFASVARGTTRALARGYLVLCLAALPTGCLTRPLSGPRYEEGFRTWAAKHVPVDAIRQWNTALPVAAAATTVPAGQWPREVAALAPATVTQLPGGRGVVLEWGLLASWGTSRKVAVCASADVAAPPEVHYLWAQVGDGVYAAFQDTN